MKSKIKYLLALCLAAMVSFTACDDTEETGAAGLSVESINPVIGGPGTELIINGTGFPLDKSKIAVTINNVAIPVDRCSEEQILVVIPENKAIGKAPVKVTVDGATVQSPGDFTYFNEKVSIESISPTSGGPGTELTITGENFPAGGTGVVVTVNGVELAIKSADESEIVVTIPNNPEIGKGVVVVTIGNKPLESEEEFTFIEPEITVTSVSPLSGGFMTEITVNGTNFPTDISKLTVTINSIPLTVVSATPTKIVATIPQNEAIGTGPVVVKFGSKTATSTDSFTYVSSDMEVTGFTPASGTYGTEVTITGENFPESGVVVKINDVEIPIKSSTETEIVVTIPKNNKIGVNGKSPIVVIDGGDKVGSETGFAYQYTRKVVVFAGSEDNPGYEEGTGTDARFSFWRGWEQRRCGIDIDDNSNLYVTDPGNQAIRKITSGGVVSTIQKASRDGWDGTWIAESGTDGLPMIVYGADLKATGAGKVYVADNFSLGTVVLLGENNNVHYMGDQGGVRRDPRILAIDEVNDRIYAGAPNGHIYCKTGINDYGPAASQFNWIMGGDIYAGGLAVHPQTGDLYVSDVRNNKIYKYVKDQWDTQILVAGTGNDGFKDGSALEAEFSHPWAICFDNYGNLLVAGCGIDTVPDSGYGEVVENKDKSIRYINLTTNMVTTFAGSGESGSDVGTSYTTEAFGGVNNTAVGVTLQNSFQHPTSMVVDKDDNVYVLDRRGDVIKKIITE